MTRPRITVSDHAVLRFLSRAGGHDVEALRQAMADSIARATAAAAVIGAGEYRIVAGDLTWVVINGVVVTVIDERPVKAARPPREREA